MNGTMFSRSPYSSGGGSPPITSSLFGRTDAFSHPPHSGATSSQIYGSSPTTTDRHGSDRPPASLAASISDPVTFASGFNAPSGIIIRRLPHTIGQDALGSMLIFAGDLIDTEFIRSPYPEDRGFATAYARFKTLAGAMEAQQKLHGKPNTSKEANMIVEMHNSGLGLSSSSFERRATVDASASRGQTSSSSSGTSSAIGNVPPGRSRYGSTFQIADQAAASSSPPSLPTASSSGGSSGEFPSPETSTHFQSIFSPTSPVANGVADRSRISGKSIINDSTDDETGELLRDPLTFARNGPQAPSQRRTLNNQIPISRFGSLSLSTTANAAGVSNAVGSPQPGAGLVSPRQQHSLQSPVSPTSGGGGGVGPPGRYNFNNPKHQYPPINPADQNPPCNTLYVGNLPIDTSEDELKQLFSKQRGYKRLCFRTKHNGPMCFVEFEDVSFATKALNELYGHLLHNSVKGGIRLSFSKNPLGVRSGQTNGIGPNMVMSPLAMSPGYINNHNGIMSNGGFSAASGPPPGLPTPGMIGSGGGGGGGGGSGGGGGYRSPSLGLDGMFANPFGVPPYDFGAQTSPRGAMSGGVPPSMGSGTFGREPRGAAYSDYMLGR